MKGNPLPQKEIIAKALKKSLKIKKKTLLQNQQANFNQTWYKSSYGKGNSKLYKSKARSSSKGNNHKKCRNRVGSFKNLQEPQSQKSSDLHKSILT
jgi:hypothetical protein